MTRPVLGDVKGIDRELHHQVKVAAAKRRITIAQWYNEAIANQLKEEGKKEKK